MARHRTPSRYGSPIFGNTFGLLYALTWKRRIRPALQNA